MDQSSLELMKQVLQKNDLRILLVGTLRTDTDFVLTAPNIEKLILRSLSDDDLIACVRDSLGYELSMNAKKLILNKGNKLPLSN